MKKEHFEMILEDINGKFSHISEGIQVLDNKIDNVNKELKSDMKELRNEMVVRFDYLDRKIDDVRDELKHDIKQIYKITDNHEERLTNVEAKVVNL